MKKNRIVWLIAAGAVLLAVLAVTLPIFIRASKQIPVLKAEYSYTKPNVDGKAIDKAWKNASTTTVSFKSGLKVKLKAIYTEDSVYILANYPDSTKTDTNMVWQYDGSRWIHGPISDEFAVFFNTNNSIKDFAEKGLDLMTIKPGRKGGQIMDIELKGGKVVRRGRAMISPFQNYCADIWHMSMALSNPLGKAFDYYFTALEGSYNIPGAPSSDVVVQFDRKGVTNNTSLFPFKFAEKPSVQNKKKGNNVPYMVFTGTALSGSGADVDGKAIWTKGFWTVELGRKLNTTHSDDIRFKPSRDKNVSYTFALVVRTDGEKEVYSRPVRLEFVRRK